MGAASTVEGPSRPFVQLYEVVRTAHLERAAGHPGSVVLYRDTRYDFDAELAARVQLVQAGVVGAFRFGLRNRIDVVEVNEPFVVGAAPRTLALLAGHRLGEWLGDRPSPTVVAYAIDSLDPAAVLAALPVKARLRQRLQLTLMPLVWRRLDRLVYGTGLAKRLYEERFGASHHQPATRLVEAVPAPADVDDLPEETEQRIVFLGDMSERKGFPDVLASWPAVREAHPGASLTLVGRGAGLAAAAQLAQSDPRVEVVADPPRERIFQELRQARVLVLPSRRMPLWREQVGLPIVEGLSRGCEIVTTTETGIARWLEDHGHQVVRPEDGAAGLTAGIVAALGTRRTKAQVVSDLPAEDGRALAHRWLLTGDDQEPTSPQVAG